MSSRRPTHSQYAQQKVIELFGELIQYYNEQGLTHISRVLSYLAITEGFGYEVHRYITTSALRYEEWSDKRPWTDEAEW